MRSRYCCCDQQGRQQPKAVPSSRANRGQLSATANSHDITYMNSSETLATSTTEQFAEFTDSFPYKNGTFSTQPLSMFHPLSYLPTNIKFFIDHKYTRSPFFYSFFPSPPQ